MTQHDTEPRPWPPVQEPLLRQLIREALGDIYDPQMAELWRQLDPRDGTVVARLDALEGLASDMELRLAHLEERAPQQQPGG